MLIVPYGWDQPDNAARVQRLGVGLHLPRSQYSVEKATAALQTLLATDRFSRQAKAVKAAMAAEDGVAPACNAIDSVLGFKDPSIERSVRRKVDVPWAPE